MLTGIYPGRTFAMRSARLLVQTNNNFGLLVVANSGNTDPLGFALLFTHSYLARLIGLGATFRSVVLTLALP